MIKWSINQLAYVGADQRVVTIYWVCTATDGARQGSYNGQTGIVYKPDASFTPFNELTQEQVLAWLFASLGEDDRAAAEAEALNALAQAPVSPSPPPWDA